MKLIKVGNYSFQWFLTIAICFELKKSIATFSRFFFTKSVKPETEILAFYDKALQPMRIQIRSASQNDSLDFSFLKDINAVAEKWLERDVNR